MIRSGTAHELRELHALIARLEKGYTASRVFGEYQRNVDWMMFWLQDKEDADPSFARWRDMREESQKIAIVKGKEELVCLTDVSRESAPKA